MGLCTRRVIELLAILLVANLGHVHADCDVCQNYVACHSERVFSLCIDGKATRNYLTCPRAHVCTTDDNICYPKSEAIQTCPRPYIIQENHINRCGVCNQPDRVFSCINETTIAFCFGNDKPNYEAIGVCSEGMVCDLENKLGFCSKSTRVQPSCVPSKAGEKQTTTEIVSTHSTMRRTEGSTTKTPETDNTTSTTAKSMTKATKPTINTSSIKPTATSTKPTTKTIPTTRTTTTRKTIPTTRTTTTTKTIPTRKSTPTTKTIPTKRKTEKSSKRKTTATTTKRVITKSPPTTSTTHESTTSTRKPRTPETVCREKKKPGYFAQDADPTCTKFVSCYENVAGKLTGDERDCEDDEYFDPKTAACGKKKPKGCA